MIPWSAYAPRRARDVSAWLRAKGVTTRAQLSAELLALGIDPSTFPEVDACEHLATLCFTPTDEPIATTAPEAVEEPAPSGTAPASFRRPKKRTLPPS